MSSTENNHSILNLPWSIQPDQFGTSDRTVHIVQDAAGLPVTIPAFAPDTPDQKQLALVAVVNSHDALVAALYNLWLSCQIHVAPEPIYLEEAAAALQDAGIDLTTGVGR